MNKRDTINIASFNIIKGFAMTIVIIAHMLFNYNYVDIAGVFPLNILLEFLKSGVVPVFFLVSGFGFKERPVKTMVKKTFSEFVIPYIKVMIVITLLFPLCHYISYRWWLGAIQETIKYTIAFLLGIPKYGKELFGLTLYWNTPVWFFLALFIAINVLNILLKIKNAYIRHIALLLILFTGFLLLNHNFNYYCIPQGFLATGFCYVGFLIKKYKFFTFPNNNRIIWVFIAIFAIWQCIYSEFNLADGVFKHGILSYIGAACVSVLLMVAGLYFGNIDNPLCDMFGNIGYYSYWIMCVHSVESTCIPWYRLQELVWLPDIVIFIMEISLKIIIIWCACRIIKKIFILKNMRKLTIDTK